MHLDIHLQRVVHFVATEGRPGATIKVPEDVCPTGYLPDVQKQLEALGLAVEDEGQSGLGEIALHPRAQRQIDRIAKQYRAEEIAWQILAGIEENPHVDSAQELVTGKIIAGQEVTEDEAEQVTETLRENRLIDGVGTSQGPLLSPELTRSGRHLVANEETPMDYTFPGVASGVNGGTNYNVNFSGSNVSGASFGDGNTIHASQDNRTQSVNFGESVQELRQLIADADLDESSRLRLEDRVEDIEDSAEDKGLLARSLNRFIDFVSTKLADKAAEGTVTALVAGAQAIAMTQGIAL